MTNKLTRTVSILLKSIHLYIDEAVEFTGAVGFTLENTLGFTLGLELGLTLGLKLGLGLGVIISFLQLLAGHMKLTT